MNDDPSAHPDPDHTLVDEIKTFVATRILAMSDAEITRQITILWTTSRQDRLAVVLQTLLNQEWKRRHPSSSREAKKVLP